ncbi:hypothetical protein GARC_4071 [Paraglaciecola arctica BSs20135]|uniref:Uncharacterized protein n=1 Tax=Paraglaciecola arctica BSs20135 TaxID=493475 RepID=K6YWB7_9ALTE|nr:hypothetical protein GARC_4071 [Paraglaciecola arctica BSs20135]
MSCDTKLKPIKPNKNTEVNVETNLSEEKKREFNDGSQ